MDRTIEKVYPGKRCTIRVVKLAVDGEDCYEIEVETEPKSGEFALYYSDRIGSDKFNKFKAYQIARRLKLEKNRIMI